jgi:hypothetical protein
MQLLHDNIITVCLCLCLLCLCLCPCLLCLCLCVCVFVCDWVLPTTCLLGPPGQCSAHCHPRVVSVSVSVSLSLSVSECAFLRSAWVNVHLSHHISWCFVFALRL